jgi:tetratricopeptide (TPR) repeat protein
MNEKVFTLENEAEALREAGKFEEAIAKLREALELDEKFVRAHLALSVLYQKLHDYEKSCYHAEVAVEIEPQDPFNHAALSVTYQRAFEGTRDPMYIHKAEAAMARSRGY